MYLLLNIRNLFFIKYGNFLYERWLYELPIFEPNHVLGYFTQLSVI